MFHRTPFQPILLKIETLQVNLKNQIKPNVHLKGRHNILFSSCGPGGEYCVEISKTLKFATYTVLSVFNGGSPVYLLYIEAYTEYLSRPHTSVMCETIGQANGLVALLRLQQDNIATEDGSHGSFFFFASLSGVRCCGLLFISKAPPRQRKPSC